MATLYCTCDLCFVRAGRFVHADHQNVRIDIDGMSGVLDLCESHNEQLLGPVLDAIRDRKEDDAGFNRHRNDRHTGPFQCLILNCVSPPLKHRSSMWQHVRTVHEITLPEYEEKYGDLVPLTEEEQAEIVVEVSCPVCGKRYSTELGHRWPKGALNSHLRGRHGLKTDGKTPVG